MKVLDSMWCNTSAGTFGLVIGEDPIAGRKIYAGVITPTDEKLDELWLLAWGTKLNVDSLKRIISLYEQNPEVK